MSFDTIEPSLLARFQDDFYSYEPPALELPTSIGQLPPLRDVVGHDVSTRRSNTVQHNDQATTSSQFSSQGKGVANSASIQQSVYQSSGKQQTYGTGNSNRALGDSSPQSLRKILDNDTDTTIRGSSKKRPNPESVKDDLIQLPQPPKKPKTATQIVPPIIIGLHEIPSSKEPPSYKFPRIESGAFRDSNGRNSLNTAVPQTLLPEPSSQPEVDNVEESIETNNLAPKQAKKKRNSTGARRKWEAKETEWLIQGAHKHGVGNWTAIVNDPEYSFEGRTAAAMKDRFRTVCPSGLLKDLEVQTTSPVQERAASKSPKFRGHRKDKEDLAKLGIETPFRKSSRRERKPYSEKEDHEILRAHEIHGNQWSKMRSDRQFSLQDRTSTDLRDRYRNIMMSKERGSSPLRSNKEKDEPHDNDALLSVHPSSSNLVIPGQESLSLQTSTLNSGEPRPVEGLSSNYPLTADLYSQSQAWAKELIHDSRSKDALPNLLSLDLFPSSQASATKPSEPWMRESTQSVSIHSKNGLPSSYHQLPDVDLRVMTIQKTDESWPKDHQALSTSHQTNGLRIQEIISPEAEDTRPSALFNFNPTYNPYTENHLGHLGETSESLSYSLPAPFDWNPTITSLPPFTQNLSQGMTGDMDINRLLQTDDQWSNEIARESTHGMDGKERQSFTNINSILSSNDEPLGTSQTSYLTMLNADGPLSLYD
ncbi:uncharacterized protein RSE6_12095 [Rhynchosporium secalis]|uniref:Myb-like domain-containing protein n=1 Tax=Rhynchosporium secalis TaxID=38038 RepID=A0A1E1MPK6_RHYSE|nr:uncharacterized protein RSE6_12095 [Rhynchosporium secalis]